jgi:hypothetical protein
MAARRRQEHEHRMQREQLRQKWENESRQHNKQKQPVQRRSGEVSGNIVSTLSRAVLCYHSPAYVTEAID